MENEENKIGDLLKKKRKEKNLTMIQLGDAIGVTNGTISKWERGQIKNMKRDKMESLCNVLGIPPMVLINGVDDNICYEHITSAQFKNEVSGLLCKCSDLSDQERQIIKSVIATINDEK